MQHETPQDRTERRKEECESLLDYASKNNLSVNWAPPSDIAPIDIGQEHTVWLSDEDTSIR